MRSVQAALNLLVACTKLYTSCPAAQRDSPCIRCLFLPSTHRQRSLLLAACTVVLYTPQNEHFGIVPLEAMASGRPVVACSSGGPLESVVHGSTGMLCPPEPGGCGHPWLGGKGGFRVAT